MTKYPEMIFRTHWILHTLKSLRKISKSLSAAYGAKEASDNGIRQIRHHHGELLPCTKQKLNIAQYIISAKMSSSNEALMSWFIGSFSVCKKIAHGQNSGDRLSGMSVTSRCLIFLFQRRLFSKLVWAIESFKIRAHVFGQVALRPNRRPGSWAGYWKARPTAL